MPELVTVSSLLCQGEWGYRFKRISNFYRPLEDHFEAITWRSFDKIKFVELVLNRRYKGWPEGNYRILRSIVIKARR